MTNPYEVLGISSTATDDEVKTAYRALAKKYHPDNFAEAPDLASVASEKMREINEAYDTIVAQRKAGSGWEPSGKSTTSSAGGKTYSSNSSKYNNTYSTTTSFPNVRELIMNKRFEDANAILDGIPAERRNAEWNFLKGTILYSRGWLEQAYTYLQASVNMDPNNSEFRAAFNQASSMRGGNSGGYRTGGNGGGCQPCGWCCSLMCADQCCECFGGDLISCC
ncbi:MAG: molecular chaperone DnaJ [Ruminococcaceae bacterium]|nr:molecular chaperone DnaJ [Oscillospiraceae bacterium]